MTTGAIPYRLTDTDLAEMGLHPDPSPRWMGSPPIDRWYVDSTHLIRVVDNPTTGMITVHAFDRPVDSPDAGTEFHLWQVDLARGIPRQLVRAVVGAAQVVAFESYTAEQLGLAAQRHLERLAGVQREDLVFTRPLFYPESNPALEAVKKEIACAAARHAEQDLLLRLNDPSSPPLAAPGPPTRRVHHPHPARLSWAVWAI